jgi:dolichol-phosphate mannosyltransferase
MDLTIVVPTRNEKDSVGELINRTQRALDPTGMTFEILFVDDSDDATPEAVRDTRDAGRPVRLLHRAAGEREGGLAGAVRMGLDDADESQLLAVMDGDLQHPPEVLPELVDAARNADVVVASRFVAGGGSTAGLSGPARRFVSQATRSAARAAIPQARPVRDPLSGCFLVRGDVVRGVGLRAGGFKILLEILARGRWSNVAEVPIRMAPRAHGQSNAGWQEGVAYARQLVGLRREARLRR